ncbi:hypothetical protein [Rhodobacter sp. TJ_12]|uniref:hypothetical protein n=1 Tax=Rhodobacter sp. TJ_12 TaxID=2029399 RepID=UPI001CBAFBA8|nr:hypothetical protein [Rhodobacter sp. TJ_12]
MTIETLRLKGFDMNEMGTIPREEYDRLRAAAEDLADPQSYNRAKARLVAAEDELIPANYPNRLLNGEALAFLQGLLAKEGDAI